MTFTDRHALHLARAATLIAVLAVGGLVYTWLFEAPAFRRHLLLIASSGYLLVAVFAGAGRSHAGRLIFAGLFFCWLGDLLGPGNFLLGAAMFLVAHLLFVPAFLLRGVTAPALAAGLVTAFAVTGAIMWRLHDAIPPEQRMLLYGYAAVIALMLGTALGTWPRSRSALLPLAAVVFYVSDLFLAQTAFLDGGRVWTYTGYPLYYAACLLFAWSAGEPDLPPDPAARQSGSASFSS